jgi:parallel beta-helix repeat protein
MQGNDASHSPNNAIESTFAMGNAFVRNNCSSSHYGLWLGYSHTAAIVDGNIIDNCTYGIAIEHGQNASIFGNKITRSIRAGVILYTVDSMMFRSNTSRTGRATSPQSRASHSLHKRCPAAICWREMSLRTMMGHPLCLRTQPSLCCTTTSLMATVTSSTCLALARGWRLMSHRATDVTLSEGRGCQETIGGTTKGKTLMAMGLVGLMDVLPNAAGDTSVPFSEGKAMEGLGDPHPLVCMIESGC